MLKNHVRHVAILLGVVFLVGLFAVDADAQRRRRTRRTTPKSVVTNPEIAPPGSEQDPNAETEKIISTAEDATAEADAASKQAATKKAKTPSEESMQQTIRNLSDHVNRLNDKLTQMQENDRSLIDMERLTRAEQRAESLRTQQLDVETKLADVQSKLEQVEFSIKPENIERSAAGYGSTRPEEARDARRRALEGERTRLVAQQRILETSRARLEQALVNADAEVDMLRRRLEQQRQNEDSGATTTQTRTNSRTPPQP